MPIHDWTRVDAGIFHDFDQEWTPRIKGALNAGLLPPNYYALIEQVAGGPVPDVLTLESVRRERARAGDDETTTFDQDDQGGTALATAPPKVRFTVTAAVEMQTYARKRSRVTIRHRSGDRVVAVLEIVSPGNKANQHALDSFVDKVLDFLDAGIHLLIVDLFPPGPRDPQGIHAAVWSQIGDDDFQLPPDQSLTLVAYSSGHERRAFIEPVAVGGVLPEMPLFLEPDRYVPIPLEETYRGAFDAEPKRWQEELEPKLESK